MLICQAAHTKTITVLLFSKQGNYLVSAGKDTNIYVWDASSFTLVKTLVGHKEGVNFLAFYPTNENILASVGVDKQVFIWDIAACQALQKFDKHHESVNCVAFSPDGKYLATGSTDKTIMMYHLDASHNYCAKVIQCLKGNAVTKAAF